MGVPQWLLGSPAEAGQWEQWHGKPRGRCQSCCCCGNVAVGCDLGLEEAAAGYRGYGVRWWSAPGLCVACCRSGLRVIDQLGRRPRDKEERTLGCRGLGQWISMAGCSCTRWLLQRMGWGLVIVRRRRRKTLRWISRAGRRGGGGATAARRSCARARTWRRRLLDEGR